MMEQLCFFPEEGQSKGLPKELLEYIPALFDEEQSNSLLNKFIAATPWQQRIQKIYDKEVITPRLTAWYGDPEVYDYASLTQTKPNLWTPELLMIKAKIEPLAGIKFNSVLLNYYRDGNDSVAWHSDRESVLGNNPVIASVSFGQVRSFDIRNKADHGEKYSVRLEHGSFLLMKAGLQEHWEHRIAKSIKPMRARINLTFRTVI
jgi:alkylated DNA repair dioxygenase AlkB